eukprot:g1528.t1
MALPMASTVPMTKLGPEPLDMDRNDDDTSGGSLPSRLMYTDPYYSWVSNALGHPKSVQVEVPERLRASPWRESDEVIREYFFINSRQFDHAMESKYWGDKDMNCLFQACPFSLLCVVLGPLCCMPLSQACRATGCTDRSWNAAAFNQAETLYVRRLALTRHGVAFKTLPKEPLGTVTCSESCTGQYRPHPSLNVGASSKVIPYDRIQDVKITEAAGGKVKQFCCSTYGTILDVATKVELDTAGAGIELTLEGVVDGENFRESVIALKHGAALPAASEGCRDVNPGAAAAPHAGATSAPAGESKAGEASTVNPMMSRAGVVGGAKVPRLGGGGGGGLAPGQELQLLQEQCSLLRSIDRRLEEQTALLRSSGKE